MRTAVVLIALLLCGRAQALDSEPDPAQGRGYALRGYARASNFDAGGGVEGRLVFARGLQLGVAAEALAARDAFIAGYAVSDALLVRGALRLWAPLYQTSRLAIGLRGGVALRNLSGAEGNHSSSTAVELELGMVANMHPHERVTLRLGAVIPFSLEVRPEVVNDVQGALLVGGIATGLTESIWLDLEVNTGGIFGADGDAGKFLLRGTLSLRVLWGTRARAAVGF